MPSAYVVDLRTISCPWFGYLSDSPMPVLLTPLLTYTVTMMDA